MDPESALLTGRLHEEELVVVPIWAVRNRDVILGGPPPDVELVLPARPCRGSRSSLVLLRSQLAAELDGVRLKLLAQEYFVLEHLALRPGDACEAAQLAAVMSGSKTEVPSSRVREAVHHIRRVLDDPAGRWLQTLPQRGYAWAASTSGVPHD